MERDLIRRYDVPGEGVRGDASGKATNPADASFSADGSPTGLGLY